MPYLVTREHRGRGGCRHASPEGEASALETHAGLLYEHASPRHVARRFAPTKQPAGRRREEREIREGRAGPTVGHLHRRAFAGAEDHGARRISDLGRLEVLAIEQPVARW